ncbi:hypothetical protein SAMN05421890_1594 [Ensifer adhaerens]|nr:hypothetical protein SAMN05421890_1594 [Ensifer adhaerens]
MSVINQGDNVRQGKVSPISGKPAMVALSIGLVLLLAALACLHAYVLNFRHFYQTGPYLLDTGWYVGLFRAVDPLLANPLTIGKGSYFNVHFSPIFVVLAGLRTVLDADLLSFGFWFFTGLSMLVVLAPLAIAACVQERSERLLLLPIAAAGGLAWAWSTFVGGFFGYPHPETIYGFLAPVGFVLLLRGRVVSGSILLAILLLFREDMGFHIFSFAFLCFLWLKLSRGDEALARRCLALSVCVFVYSLVGLFIQKHYFVADNALARIYLGNPPLAHVNLGYIWESLSSYVADKPDMAVLPLLCVALAIVFLEPIYLIGAMAVAPWVLLNSIAIAPAARTLSLYYAFPLLLTAAWPLVVSTIFARRRMRLQRLLTFTLFALQALYFHVDLVPKKSVAELRNLVAEAQTRPDSGQESLFASLLLKQSQVDPGRVFASAATASLTGAQIPPGQLLGTEAGEAFDRRDAVLTLFPAEHGLSDYGARIVLSNRRVLQFGNTPILIAYDRDQDIAAFRDGAAAAGVPLADASLLGALMKSAPPVRLTPSGTFMADRPFSGTFAYGPYLNLPKGRYRFQAVVDTRSCAANPCRMDIVIMARGQEVLRKSVEVEAGAKTQIAQDFAFETDEAGQRYENAVLAPEPWTGQLSALTLTRLGD